MSKEQNRAFIKIKFLEGKSPKDIHAELQNTLGESAPSKFTVKYWVNEFKWNRESIKDEHHSGRPVDVSTPEMVQKVAKDVEEDRRISIRFLSNKYGVSICTIQRILHNSLGLRKIQSHWVTKLLTNFQKHQRMNASEVNLALLHSDEENFYSRLVTQDETWVYHYDPMPRHMTKEWLGAGDGPSQVAKSMPSSNKLMASVWWDCEGILMIKYFNNDHKVTGLDHANQLRELRDILKSKRRGKLTKGVLLLQDNAPVHKSHIAMAAAEECGYQLVEHPPYSPDMAPSDYYLFPWLKSKLCGHTYGSNSELICTVNDHLNTVSSEFF